MINWEATSVIIALLVAFGALMAFIFQPRWSCGQCQRTCRSEIYHEIGNVANKVNDRSELLTAVNAKLDVLLLGLNIKVESKKNQ